MAFVAGSPWMRSVLLTGGERCIFKVLCNYYPDCSEFAQIDICRTIEVLFSVSSTALQALLLVQFCP